MYAGKHVIKKIFLISDFDLFYFFFVAKPKKNVFRLMAWRLYLRQQRARRVFEKSAIDCFLLSTENAMKLLCERGMAKARITVNDEENYDATTINLTVKDDIVHGVRCGNL